ncbi:hypothetical protein ABK040_001689 [Willaertia magna]
MGLVEILTCNWYNMAFGAFSAAYLDSHFYSIELTLCFLVIINIMIIWIMKFITTFRCCCSSNKSNNYDNNIISNNNNHADTHDSHTSVLLDNNNVTKQITYHNIFRNISNLIVNFFIILSAICVSVMILALSVFSRIHFSITSILISILYILLIAHLQREEVVVKKENKNNIELIDKLEKGVLYVSDKIVFKPSFIMRYLLSIKNSLTNHPLKYIFLSIVILVISFLVSLMSCDICIAYGPIDVSTEMTRRFGQGRVCEENSVCFSYFTLAEDLSDSMIANFHLSLPMSMHTDVKAFTYITTDISFIPPYNVTANSPTSIDDNPKFKVVNSTCFRLFNIYSENRWQCWTDLIDLSPNTTYYVRSAFLRYEPEITELIFDSIIHKVRTAPESIKGNEEIVFVEGGDLEWNSDTMKLSETISQKVEPLFAVIAGDVAYENGYRYCYRRFDNWFVNWNNHMKTASGYSVPILTSIGNHEAGNFLKSRDYDAFYIRYFPHQTGLQNIDPQKRDVFHYHLIGDNSIIVILDSVVHTMPLEQVDFINKTFEQFSYVKNKMVAYHAPMYPCVPLSDYERSVFDEMNINWEPLFWKYGVQIAFENHVHAYKQTYPLKGGLRNDEDGVVYLGDGKWGGVVDQVDLDSNNPIFRQTGLHSHVYVTKCKEDRIEARALAYDEDLDTTFYIQNSNVTTLQRNVYL